MGKPSHPMKPIQIVLQSVPPLSFPFSKNRSSSILVIRCGWETVQKLMRCADDSVWDSSDEYGPVIGLTRLERFVPSSSLLFSPLTLLRRRRQMGTITKDGTLPAARGESLARCTKRRN